MSTATITATNIQDPSGQLFKNGTWNLQFVPTYGLPLSSFNDGGASFTQQFSGTLDATGSFSFAGVTRNDTITPAGSQWEIIIKSNTSDSAVTVRFSITSDPFDITTIVNAAISTIFVYPTGITFAYKDSEILNPKPGSIYYDVTLQVLKIWDDTTSTWLQAVLGTTVDIKAPHFIANAAGTAAAPSFTATLDQTTGMYLPGVGVFAITVGGANKLAIDSGGHVVLGSGTTFGFSSNVDPTLASADTLLTRVAANNFRMGVTAGVPDSSGRLDLTILNAITGIRINGGATSGHVLRGDGTNFIDAALASTDLSDVASLVTLTGIQIVTNKRITPRTVAVADATSITPNSDTSDITTQVNTQVAGTLTLNAPTGTPTDGQSLRVRIKTTNAQTYSFNAAYRFSTSVTAPASISAGKTDYIGCMWNATDSKWDVVAVDQGH